MQREAEAAQIIERLVEGKEGDCQPGRKRVKRNKDRNDRKETAEGTQQHSQEDGRRKRGEKRKIKVAREQR